MRYMPALESQPPALARNTYRLFGAMFDGDRIELAEVRNEQLDAGQGVSLRARVYVPASCRDLSDNPGLVYFHGGGCVIGDLESHDGFCRLIASNNSCIVVSVAYRLSPECPYPTPLLDAIASWNWVCTEAGRLGLDLFRTGVGGDSAGGLLATTVCQQQLDPTLSAPVSVRPAFQWLIYPWLDCRLSTESAKQCLDGMVLTRSTMAWFIRHYLRGAGVPASDPRVSPLLRENLRGMPPTYLSTAGFDPLRDEGLQYAKNLAAAGVDVRSDHFGDVMHGFIGFRGICPDARRYTEKMLQQLCELQEGPGA